MIYYWPCRNKALTCEEVHVFLFSKFIILLFMNRSCVIRAAQLVMFSVPKLVRLNC